VLRRIFGSKWDEIREDWRRLYIEKFNDLYWSPTIVRVIKWRRMKGVGHVARMGGNERCIPDFGGQTWWAVAARKAEDWMGG
jgi:hypothetical protein